jgi:acyl-CoA thioesterase YciA
VIRVVAMPADTNPSGDMFGGWLVSQMDLAAWVKARKHTARRLVTVAIDNIVFHKPVFVGDCLICHATLERVGRTSMTILVEAEVERVGSLTIEPVTEGRFTFVAIGEDFRPVPIDATSGGSA